MRHSAPLSRQCPQCRSTSVHASRRRNSLETLLSILGVHILRCHRCLSRRAWFGDIQIKIGDGEVRGTVAGIAAVMSGTGAVLAALLAYLRFHHL